METQALTEFEKQTASLNEGNNAEPLIQFLKLSEIRNYQPPEGHNLVGDYHIQKEAPFVIAGAPGVGKSRAANYLAIAGALGVPWFGLPIHRPFRTMILQAENGKVRLRDEFAEFSQSGLEDKILISSPPPYGFAFANEDFFKQLQEAVLAFEPDVFIVDPWNKLARDDKAADYLAAFNMLQSVLPKGEKSPALGIVAHTRKPKSDERANGRALLNLIAGSYTLGSIPRAAFVIQAASDDPEDDRIVFTCCKNNDGDLGMPSAWHRRNGIFMPVDDFDWEAFNGSADSRKTINEADLNKLFEGGQTIARKQAVERLMEMTGLSQRACYNALSLEGRFAGLLAENNGLLCLRNET
jgi:hypothetical protein